MSVSHLAQGESAGPILTPSVAVLAEHREGAEDVLSHPQAPSPGSAVLSCMAGSLLPARFMLHLRGRSRFHGRHSAAMPLLPRLRRKQSDQLRQCKGLKEARCSLNGQTYGEVANLAFWGN